VDGVRGWENIVEAVRSGEIDVTNNDGGLYLTNTEDAVRLYDMAVAGQLGDREEEAIAALRDYDGRNPGAVTAVIQARQAETAPPPQEAPPPQQTGITPGRNPLGMYGGMGAAEFAGSMAYDAATGIVGLADLAKTFVGGAAAEVAAGVIGLGNMALDAGAAALSSDIDYDLAKSLDDTANLMNNITDSMNAVTGPWTQTGEMMLETVAAPLMQLDEAARDLAAMEEAKWGPGASTLAYTVMVGAPELLGLKGYKSVARTAAKAGPGNKMRAKRQANEQAKMYKQAAEDMGLKPTQDDLIPSLVNAAKGLRQATRGEGLPGLRESLLQQKNLAKAARDEAAAIARATQGAVKAQDVVAMGQGLEQMLRVAGYQLDEISDAKSILADLQNMDKVSPTMGKRDVPGANAVKDVESSPIQLPDSVRRDVLREAADTEAKVRGEQTVGLDELWAVRNKLDRALRKTDTVKNSKLADQINPHAALKVIDRHIDDFLDARYTDDMMKGSIDAWRQADQLRNYYNKTFKDDKFIANLVQRGATAQDLRSAFMGRSATAPKVGSAAALRRFKELIGPDHPAVAGIAADFVHELMSPLLGPEGPNFERFIKGIDDAQTNHADFMRELGMNQRDVHILRDYATTARMLPKKHPFWSKEMIAAVAARFGFGHAISQAGMKVGLIKRAFMSAMGEDTVSQKRIIMQTADNVLGRPAVDPNTTTGQFILMSGIAADISGMVEEDN
jgi:hypothetical protein